MADDQVRIDPEFDSPRGRPEVDHGSGPKWVGLALVGVALLSLWLLRSLTPEDRESSEETTTRTTVVTVEITRSPTTTLRIETVASEEVFLYEGYLVLSGLVTPNDVEIDPTGGLFVSETGAARVARIEILPDGSVGDKVIVASGIADAEGLALSEDGVLYVSGANAVYRVVDGVVTVLTDGFTDPEGLAIDEDGDLYVADDSGSGIRISKVTVLPDGTAGGVTEVIVVPGRSAADIDFGPTGKLFVANDVDTVWVLEFAKDGSVTTESIAVSGGHRALAFDASGTLYLAGDDLGSVWTVEPGGSPVVFAKGFSQVEGLAVDVAGTLYVSNVATNEILRFDTTPVDPSGALANPSTTSPDFVGALFGDSGGDRLPVGLVVELPSGLVMDFLYEYCEPECFRDAVSFDPQSGERADSDPLGTPFYVRQGFVNNGADPLGEGFDVVMYLTRWDGPDLPAGAFGIGQTYRYTSDYVIRGTTDQCGPTYRTQTEPQNCEWFVHDFPEGLPTGRYDLWAVWEAPCRAWLDMAFTDECANPDEIVSFFSSGVNSAFGGAL